MGWEPDDLCRGLARQAGIRTDELDAVVARFRAHHRGAGTTSPNWAAKFESWCFTHVDRRKEREARDKPKTGRFQMDLNDPRMSVRPRVQ